MIPGDRSVILVGQRHFLFSWRDTLAGSVAHGDTKGCEGGVFRSQVKRDGSLSLTEKSSSGTQPMA